MVHLRNQRNLKNSEITKNEIKRVVDLRSKDVKEKSLYKFDGKKSEIERIISSKKPEEGL